MITFNPEGYKKLLQSLVHNYQVVTFDQAVDIKSSELTGVCCLRHDIDYCLNTALKMASVEKDSNIFSSYFFLVDSDYYNVLSERSAAIISEISQMGHEIALHFNIAGYPIVK
ncbi:MAG: hypothetical protein WCP46_09505 [Alphaproteobacteria bacterium]